ncbi:MAG: ABC transporter permease [Candidatus Xenobia bacterium]
MPTIPEPLLALGRRRVRTALSLLGLAAGVFAMQLIAAVAANFTATARGFERNFLHRLFVCERISFWAGGGILSDAKAAEVARVPGVAHVVPVLIGRIFQERMLVLGAPEVLVGAPPLDAPTLWEGAHLAAGRWLGPRDADGVVLGAEIAQVLQAHVGAPTTFLGATFPVLGVLAPTGTLLDRQAIAPLARAQAVLHREGLLTDVIVTPAAGQDAEALSDAIRHQVHEVEVITPGRLAVEIRQSVGSWEAIARVLELAAALSGAAAVAIAAAIGVHERSAEIGLRRAIGASRGQIMGDLLVESLVLLLLGWGLGSLLGFSFVDASRPALQAMGAAIFTFDASVLVRSLMWTLLVGLVAAAVPAHAASRLDPVRALRQ